MKFTRHGHTEPATYWTGIRPLPAEINVISHDLVMAEWELLTIIGMLHGRVSPYDIMTGADQGTEKDDDITSILNAFHNYVHPRMPISRYTPADTRIKPKTEDKK